MPVSFRIYFDRPHAAYFAGETVTGRLVMNVDKPKKVRAVTIHFKGEASVRWGESTGKKRAASGRELVTYTSRETYFENTQYFLGSDDGEVNLSRGEYVYNFQCLLPAILPSSFEGVFGYIRYTAKACMHRPWKFDSGARAAFTVVAPVDLNLHPQVREPVVLETSKHFCCLWCRSGPLTMGVRLPTGGGYVPGQTVLLQIQLDNASTITVEGIHCALSKEVKWHASRAYGPLNARAMGEKTKITSTDVSQASFLGEVPPHGSKSFTHILQVPPLPPSNLANCSIIDLQYILKVTARVNGCYLNLNVTTPVLIGTFPVRVTDLDDPSDPQLPQPPSDSAGTAAGPSSAPTISPDLLPPSYEECIFRGNSILEPEDGDNEYTMGIHQFTPRYPVWDLNSSDPPKYQENEKQNPQ